MSANDIKTPSNERADSSAFGQVIDMELLG